MKIDAAYIESLAKASLMPATTHPEAAGVVLIDPEERDAIVAELRSAAKNRDYAERVVGLLRATREYVRDVPTNGAESLLGRIDAALAANPINGESARARAPECAHPEGGQNKSGQSVADSATASPPNTTRVESQGGHNIVVTLPDGASAVFLPSCDIAIEVSKRLRDRALKVNEQGSVYYVVREGEDWRPWPQTSVPRPPTPEDAPFRTRRAIADWGGVHFLAVRFGDGNSNLVWNAKTGWSGVHSQGSAT